MMTSKEKSRRIREKRMSAGFCIRCGKLPPRLGKSTCEICAEKYAAYCKKNREEKNKSYNAWYARNKEKMSQKRKYIYLNNIEEIKRKQRVYYQKHTVECNATSAAWRERNIEYHREQASKYQISHPESHRAACRNRRARELSAQGNGINKEQWESILSFYGNKCLKCGSEHKLTMDHVIPLFLGGHHATYNIQPLCKKCNCSKGIRTIDYRHIQDWT